MGDRNSEHSGSMDSDELSNLVGHNYALAVFPQPPQPLVHVFEESFHTEDVMGSPLSLETRRRIQERSLLILNDGTEQNASGPASSRASHGTPLSPEEVNSVRQVDTPNCPGNLNTNSSPSPNFISEPTASLAMLQENIAVKNGVLTITNFEHGEPSKTKKNVTWSSLLSESVAKKPVHNLSNCNVDMVEITYNDDGSANIFPSRELLLNAQKQWETSLIGHFIGGSFAFKFVRDQAFRLWNNLGLSRVYYSSKGYFTFRFKTVEEKNRVLALNTVQMGGKTLYLIPWMEGSSFKKNVIDRVPCWIKLVDVPHSYWTKECLYAIAKAVGKPLKFDEATARLEPLKYAGVQVELKFSSPRPTHVWIPVINKDGVEEREKIEVQYAQLPYSCSSCRAFGHSFSRCSNNPEAVKRIPVRNSGNNGNLQSTNVEQQNDHASPAVTNPAESTGANLHREQTAEENYFQNMDLVPYKIGEFCGCDVVLDEDQILQEIQNSVEEGECPISPTPDQTSYPTAETVQHSAEIVEVITDSVPISAEPITQFVLINTEQATGTSTDTDNTFEPETTLPASPSTKHSVSPARKRKQLKDEAPAPSGHPVVIALSSLPYGAGPPLKHASPSKKSVVDEEGFTQVTYKKSPRLSGPTRILRRHR